MIKGENAAQALRIGFDRFEPQKKCALKDN